MKFNAPKSKILIVVFALLIASMHSCKKEVLVTNTGIKVDAAYIQQRFLENNLGEKLTTKLGETIKVEWMPDWSKITSKTQDTLSYYYVPLILSSKKMALMNL